MLVADQWSSQTAAALQSLLSGFQLRQETFKLPTEHLKALSVCIECLQYSQDLPESSLVLQLLVQAAEATTRPAELLQAPVVNRLLHLVSQLLHLHLQHLQLALQHLWPGKSHTRAATFYILPTDIHKQNEDKEFHREGSEVLYCFDNTHKSVI
ncbi:hypothetical protein EYF80_042201 [Liparis tanakae]|uniref:Uncharacterized protein n=1 Tax=Liparis tanakae TaxID=230148 RepID=A0A4Z2G218_9TELE|nr:hypothetical protein EYF80_042201 [Liparis tanakae]